jgi:hypothetical protein
LYGLIDDQLEKPRIHKVFVLPCIVTIDGPSMIDRENPEIAESDSASSATINGMSSIDQEKQEITKFEPTCFVTINPILAH